MAETLFGSTITLSTGRIVPVRWIGEQHVREDFGFIPSFADWVKAIRPVPWMGRALRLSDSLETTTETLRRSPRMTRFCSVRVTQAKNAICTTKEALVLSSNDHGEQQN